MICKIHDLCFATFGADNFYCDRASTPIVSSFKGETTFLIAQTKNTVSKGACKNQYREIIQALSIIKSKKSSQRMANTQSIIQILELPFVPSTLILHWAYTRLFGYPERDGLCFFSEEESKTIYSQLEDGIAEARAYHECNEDNNEGYFNTTCFGNLYKEYRDETSIGIFLESGFDN